ncbi:transferrin receptor protein 2 [Pelodytes ibericus]
MAPPPLPAEEATAPEYYLSREKSKEPQTGVGGPTCLGDWPTNSYSIYHGVEDQEGAELHMEENHEEDQTSQADKKRSWLPEVTPQCQKILIGTFVIAIVAFILGILVTYGTCASCNQKKPETGDETDTYTYQESDEPNTHHWTDFREDFNTYLKDGQEIEKTIRRVCRASHAAGSDEDKDLAEYVLENLKTYDLDHTWIDTHFVELQYPNRNMANSLKIIDSENQTVQEISIGDPDLYAPYSATGTVVSGLIYANYGRREDFKTLADSGLKITGQLVIVRIGLMSFAEKVNNAQAAGAAGVLIFPDTEEDLSVFGHVHFGTGDPSTPGFPSFNHTQFPPFKSSGLPTILAQPISKVAAQTLLSKMGGGPIPNTWRGDSVPARSLGPELSTTGHRLSLEVGNVVSSVELYNVFGSVTGRIEPEHYIVVGAQRDSWGPGAAKSAVGTAILLELARTIGMMVKNGFQPHRSLLFVSWDAGDFGSVGATEWLEGYLSMLHLKAAAYMSLDTAVLGDEKFIVKSSPLFKSLIEFVIKQVDNPRRSKENIYEVITSKTKDWQSEVMFPLSMDTGAYAFTAFGGVPAVEFSYEEDTVKYKYLDTKMDTYNALDAVVNGRLPSIALSVAQVAGLSLIKLVHDSILPLDYTQYSNVLLTHMLELGKYQNTFKSQGLSFQWLSSARGDYMRATQNLKKAISQSDLNNEKMVQSFNVRIMRVEFYFLSQFVSVLSSPYRHILIGRGEHTIQALIKSLQQDPQEVNADDLRKKLALFTWTLKGAANALGGEVWEIQKSY